MDESQMQRDLFRRMQGRALEHGSLAYSAQMERVISSLPIIPGSRGPLMTPDGKFRFAPDPLGTGASIPGLFYVDHWGKWKPY
ncbi:hypothetical protein HNQ39_005975 [Armatimonas rosea]|uniref:Uncharacterized protein n=1 Tax=Armatimonas rosea TaxID=685828 RepID=A0A7W9SX95_ARMRO|nr:hypothetical protein [Armatimonas rosea]